MLEDVLQPPEDYAALKAWALEQAAALAQTRRELAQAQTGLVSASLMCEKLKIKLACLRRESYGALSERLARIEQLELQLEDLEERSRQRRHCARMARLASRSAARFQTTCRARTWCTSRRSARIAPARPVADAYRGWAKTPPRAGIRARLVSGGAPSSA